MDDRERAEKAERLLRDANLERQAQARKYLQDMAPDGVYVTAVREDVENRKQFEAKLVRIILRGHTIKILAWGSLPFSDPRSPMPLEDYIAGAAMWETRTGPGTGTFGIGGRMIIRALGSRATIEDVYGGRVTRAIGMEPGDLEPRVKTHQSFDPGAPDITSTYDFRDITSTPADDDDVVRRLLGLGRQFPTLTFEVERSGRIERSEPYQVPRGKPEKEGECTITGTYGEKPVSTVARYRIFIVKKDSPQVSVLDTLGVRRPQDPTLNQRIPGNDDRRLVVVVDQWDDIKRSGHWTWEKAGRLPDEIRAIYSDTLRHLASGAVVPAQRSRKVEIDIAEALEMTGLYELFEGLFGPLLLPGRERGKRGSGRIRPEKVFVRDNNGVPGRTGPDEEFPYRGGNGGKGGNGTRFTPDDGGTVRALETMFDTVFAMGLPFYFARIPWEGQAESWEFLPQGGMNFDGATLVLHEGLPGITDTPRGLDVATINAVARQIAAMVVGVLRERGRIFNPEDETQLARWLETVLARGPDQKTKQLAADYIRAMVDAR